jgi:hypothetical protein
MAKEVRSWEANDGSLHKSECEAAARDLEIIIAGSPCAENSPYAKTMFGWLKREARDIAAALIAYADACPVEATAEDTAPTMPYEDFATVVGEIQNAGEAGKSFLRRRGYATLAAFRDNAGPSDLRAWTAAKESIAEHTPAAGELERID